MERSTFSVKIIGIVFDPSTKKILLGKHKDEENFSFLDSELKHEEDLDISLKSVAKEKTGFKVRNLGAVFAKNNMSEKDKLNIYFLCEIAEGEENPLEDLELKWVGSAKEIEDLFGRPLTSRLREYIENITG